MDCLKKLLGYLSSLFLHCTRPARRGAAASRGFARWRKLRAKGFVHRIRVSGVGYRASLRVYPHTDECTRLGQWLFFHAVERLARPLAQGRAVLGLGEVDPAERVAREVLRTRPPVGAAPGDSQEPGPVGGEPELLGRACGEGARLDDGVEGGAAVVIAT